MVAQCWQALNEVSESGLGGHSSGSAPTTLRELVRCRSDPVGRDIVEERDRLWKEAVVVRKKKCQLALLKNKDGWGQLLGKSTARAFEGELNSNHRLFVLSLDLWEDGENAHTGREDVDEGKLEEVMKWLCSQTKDFDMILACDGCHVPNQTAIVKSLGGRIAGGGGLHTFHCWHFVGGPVRQEVQEGLGREQCFGRPLSKIALPACSPDGQGSDRRLYPSGEAPDDP